MGRPFKNVTVVKGYDADGKFVCEDIVPSDSFATSGSLLLNDAAIRADRGIRFISLRVFDSTGTRTEARTTHYNLTGQEVAANYRRRDGTIIENVDWV